jgi:hypothetical protein
VASVATSTRLLPALPSDASVLVTSYRTIQPASGARSLRRVTNVVSTNG